MDVPGRTAPRRSRVTVRRFDSAAAADRHKLEFWLQMTEAERVLHVWRLSQELCLLRGDKSLDPDFIDLLRAFIAADVRVRNKRATGRPKDLGDIEGMNE